MGEFLSAFAFKSAANAVPKVAWSTYIFTALADGYLMSEVPSAVMSTDLLAAFSFCVKPGTVGLVAVPARSPANCTFPGARVVASGAPETTTWLIARST